MFEQHADSRDHLLLLLLALAGLLLLIAGWAGWLRLAF